LIRAIFGILVAHSARDEFTVVAAASAKVIVSGYFHRLFAISEMLLMPPATSARCCISQST